MDPLQELYNHLEHVTFGDKHIAWYGQARAKGLSHRDALRDTLIHFNIPATPWYQARLRNGLENIL